MGLLCFLFGLGVWGSSSMSFWRYGSSNTHSSNATQSMMSSSSSSLKTSSFWRWRKEWCLVERFMVLGVRERESEGFSEVGLLEMGFSEFEIFLFGLVVLYF